ncbi:PH domain-containing protein [Flavobacterium sp.]|uniref:PH domain-containing protein n=1 Tax=Flavobacterium sp. TaxID=239 RepID=UPI002A7F4725|nr:PH domain-containing protein [Flavobacterium sp.]
MLENLKNILNEDQDPKAIEKIASKLENLIMSNEEVGYIAVQKKPAVTIFPDSVVVTNKRIILCKPKNLGFSMEFVDYDWDDIAGSFVKEGILGSDFTFSTKTDLTHTIDYLPKNQARKLYTFAKEQLDLLKNPLQSIPVVDAVVPLNITDESVEIIESVEEMVAEEITNFAEIAPVNSEVEKLGNNLSQEELFEKLQNYKKLLDNGLILQAEYDALKKEVLSRM